MLRLLLVLMSLLTVNALADDDAANLNCYKGGVAGGVTVYSCLNGTSCNQGPTYVVCNSGTTCTILNGNWMCGTIVCIDAGTFRVCSGNI